MKRKSIFSIVTLLALIFMLCACANTEPTPSTEPSTEPTETVPEKLTAIQIAELMEQALEKTPVRKLDMVMDITMSMHIEGIDPMEMSIITTSQMTQSQDPVSSHILQTAEISLNGEGSTTTTETYTVLENGKLVSYVYSEGIWVKVPTGLTPETFISSNSVTFDPANITLDETVTEWNGQNLLCLRTRITGDLVEAVLGDTLGGIRENGGVVGDSANILDAIDYTKLTCDCTIYLDPETYLPIGEEMAIEGMNEVMAPLYEGLGIDVNVDKCVSTVNFLSYEAQPEATVPADISAKAEAWTRLLANEPDNGDGTFTIREGGVLIDLIHPEGFEVADKDYDHVTFQRDDHRQITFTMYYLSGNDTTGAAFIAENDKSADRWITGGGQVNREQLNVSTDALTFTCDLLATTWESGREDANFYAWTALAYDEAGTYYLHVEVTDGYNDGMGTSKTADISSDEFLSYLNAASLSKLTAE